MHFGYGVELKFDLQGLGDARPEDSHHVLDNSTRDQFLLRVGRGLRKAPGKHALADQGHIFLGIIDGVDGVVFVVLVDDFGAALGNGLEACSEVDDADGVSLVNRYGLDLEGVRPPREAVLLVFIEGILNLDCAAEQRKRWSSARERRGQLTSHGPRLHGRALWLRRGLGRRGWVTMLLMVPHPGAGAALRARHIGKRHC